MPVEAVKFSVRQMTILRLTDLLARRITGLNAPATATGYGFSASFSSALTALGFVGFKMLDVKRRQLRVIIAGHWRSSSTTRYRGLLRAVFIRQYGIILRFGRFAS